MSVFRLGALSFFAAAAACMAEGFFDRLDEALTISAFDDQLRVRLSGTLDLEYYHIDSPAPGLIFTRDHSLFNPRLSLYLDAQLGPRVYVFAQARVDRGFDPSDNSGEVRLDEYALRVTPWDDGRFNFQIGKFATVVGNWAARHGSWENPFITAPLPYGTLTPIWDSQPARSSQELFSWAHISDGRGGFYGDEYADKHLRQPIVWGPAYTSGFSVFGRLGRFDYAADFKNGALSSRPENWGVQDAQWQHPAVSARVGFRPNQMWNLGISGSVGTYLEHDARPFFSRGHGITDYRQIVIAQDISFAWHRWQVWAEYYASRFEIPTIGNADTLAWYLEAKYKFTPQFFGALRWNQQFYDHIDGRRWGREIRRIDTSVAYRFTPHTQLKLQYSLQHEDDAPRDFSHTFGAQFTLRF